MVGDTLDVCRQGKVLCAHLGRASAFAQPPYMVFSHAGRKVVDGFFRFVRLCKSRSVAVRVRLYYVVVKSVNKLFQVAYLVFGFVRKYFVRFFQPVRIFDYVFGIVSDAFEIGNGTESRGEIDPVLFAQVGFQELYNELREFFIQKVELPFVCTEGFDFGIVERADDLDRNVEVVERDFRHLQYLPLGLLDCDGRVCQHMLFHKGKVRRAVFVARLVFVRHDLCHELYEKPGQRKDYCDGRHVEYRVEHRKLHLRCVREHLAEQKSVIYAAESQEHSYKHEHNYAAHIEDQVYESRALCVFRARKPGYERGHAGADVRAHRDIYSLIQRDESRDNHCYCHGRHYGRALYYGCECRADNNEQEGIFEKGKKALNRLEFGEISHCVAHHRKSYEQHTEARRDSAYFTQAVFFCEGEYEGAYSGKCGKYDGRGNGVCAEHTQRDELSRDSSADVCAENYGRRLRKRHYARVYKAYDHDGCCARALYDGGRRRAHAHTDQLALRSFRKKGFQFFTAERFEIRTHHRTGDEEYAYACDKRQYRGDYCYRVHWCLPDEVFRLFFLSVTKRRSFF